MVKQVYVVEYLKPKVMKKPDRMLKIDEDPEENNEEMLNAIYGKVEQPQSNTVINKEDRTNGNAVTNHEEAEDICSTVLADRTDYTMANTTDATCGYCDYVIAVGHNSSQVANLEINHKLSNISLSSPYTLQRNKWLLYMRIILMLQQRSITLCIVKLQDLILVISKITNPIHVQPLHHMIFLKIAIKLQINTLMINLHIV